MLTLLESEHLFQKVILTDQLWDLLLDVFLFSLTGFQRSVLFFESINFHLYIPDSEILQIDDFPELRRQLRESLVDA